MSSGSSPNPIHVQKKLKSVSIVMQLSTKIFISLLLLLNTTILIGLSERYARLTICPNIDNSFVSNEFRLSQ